jgi:hypothetical protein
MAKEIREDEERDGERVINDSTTGYCVLGVRRKKDELSVRGSLDVVLGRSQCIKSENLRIRD